MNEVSTEYVICWWPAVPGEDAGKSLVQVDAIYESLLINHCQGRIHTPHNGQWQSVMVEGERWLQLLALPGHSLILLGFRSIKAIAASYCCQTVSSVSSPDWCNDLEVLVLSVCLSVSLSVHPRVCLRQFPLYARLTSTALISEAFSSAPFPCSS